MCDNVVVTVKALSGLYGLHGIHVCFAVVQITCNKFVAYLGNYKLDVIFEMLFTLLYEIQMLLFCLGIFQGVPV